MKVSGALIEAIVKLLQSVGLLTDPAQEVEFRRHLTDMEKTRAEVWVDFVRATSPDPARVFIWANSAIALVRPTISTLIVAGMIFAPSRILDLVKTFGEAGPSGWIVMAPVLWWFFGRDVSKVLAMRYGGTIDVGSGATDPRLYEARDFPPTDLMKQQRERIDRAPDELNGADGQVPILEPEFDHPRDR